MSLAEGVSARVAYKYYSSGDITANALADSATDLVATGGQIMRRVSSALKLAKDTYRSQEVREDRQVADFRHGTRRVTGSVTGEYSPGTYFDHIEAACRGTRVAAVSASQTDFTSVSADNATSKFTFAGGNPVTKGFRVGMPVRFATLADSDNNSKTFFILSFGGTNNREMTVYPAPDTMSADTSFTVTQAGKGISIPSSGFVKRKVAFEHWHEDIEVARLFTENRIGGMNLNLPASGMSGIEFPVMGRDMELYDGQGGRSAGPFFSGPAAATDTGTCAAVNGLLRIGGSVVGVVTGITMAMNLSPTSDPVVGQDFVPEIFLGTADMTGQITANFQDGSLINSFIEEEELELLCWMTASNAAAAAAGVFHLPRIKLGDADSPLQGDGAQTISLPFQALKYQGSTAGVPQTTFAHYDTEAA